MTKREEKFKARDLIVKGLLEGSKYRPYHRAGRTYKANGAREIERRLRQMERAHVQSGLVTLSV